jgi:hypothetical protein
MYNDNYRVEVFPNEDDDIFVMKNAQLIKDGIQKMNVVGDFVFNNIDDWDLRIMKINIIEHSYKYYYLQYNTKSKRHRLIVTSPAHQVPLREGMTMESDNDISKMYNLKYDHISKILPLISNDDFWIGLYDLYYQRLDHDLKVRQFTDSFIK